ncbi:MAG: response regulator [Bdellovibrionaceae bacterium]|nr:response regulator [Pseudobdellovibrionaceae bacterium]
MDLESLRPKHILIVDDDDGIRLMLETKLAKLGYKASVAANGLHALQKMRALQPGQDKYDLMICDLKMPGMSGLDLIKTLRSEGPCQGIPILLITGYPEKQKIMEVVRTGIHRVLLKPFKQSQILSLIDEILKSPDTPVSDGGGEPSVA